MKYIEADIYSSKSKKDLLIGFLYDEDYYTLEEITNDLAKELNQDEKDWDYVSDISNNLKDDELIVRVYPSDEKSALDLKEKLEENNLGTLKFFEKDDQDWANNWKAYYKAFEIGKNLLIVPEWETYDNANNRKIVKINPGMAFGTGTHESTYMCLEALDKYVKKDMNIFDIGCGSGILGIAAIKLGGKSATLVDIDDKCIKASKENAKLNEVYDKVKVKKGNLLDVIEGKCDIIVSNIIAEIIVDEISNLSKYLSGQKIFITSGIILEKKDLVTRALIKESFEILEVKEKNDWCAIIARYV
ncbi:MAG: 50S ribosomal protein L11 methyltransferase [Peptoniphilus lacrimalis]